MQRTVKFRGKSLDTGEWVYGSLLVDNTLSATYIQRFSSLQHTLKKYEVDPATVGQYIGKQDMRGKEIYRGDIVRSPDNGEYSFTAVVEWADYGWYMEGIEPVDNFSFDDTEAHELEVVGTRYDTPNPLEATSNE